MESNYPPKRRNRKSAIATRSYSTFQSLPAGRAPVGRAPGFNEICVNTPLSIAKSAKISLELSKSKTIAPGNSVSNTSSELQQLLSPRTLESSPNDSSIDMLGARARAAEYNAAKAASARQANREAEEQNMPPKTIPVALSAYTRTASISRNKGSKTYKPLVLSDSADNDGKFSETEILSSSSDMLSPVTDIAVTKPSSLPTTSKHTSIEESEFPARLSVPAVPTAPRAMLSSGEQNVQFFNDTSFQFQHLIGMGPLPLLPPMNFPYHIPPPYPTKWIHQYLESYEVPNLHMVSTLGPSFPRHVDHLQPIQPDHLTTKALSQRTTAQAQAHQTAVNQPALSGRVYGPDDISPSKMELKEEQRRKDLNNHHHDQTVTQPAVARHDEMPKFVTPRGAQRPLLTKWATSTSHEPDHMILGTKHAEPEFLSDDWCQNLQKLVKSRGTGHVQAYEPGRIESFAHGVFHPEDKERKGLDLFQRQEYIAAMTEYESMKGPGYLGQNDTVGQSRESPDQRDAFASYHPKKASQSPLSRYQHFDQTTPSRSVLDPVPAIDSPLPMPNPTFPLGFNGVTLTSNEKKVLEQVLRRPGPRSRPPGLPIPEHDPKLQDKSEIQQYSKLHFPLVGNVGSADWCQFRPITAREREQMQSVIRTVGSATIIDGLSTDIGRRSRTTGSQAREWLHGNKEAQEMERQMVREVAENFTKRFEVTSKQGVAVISGGRILSGKEDLGLYAGTIRSVGDIMATLGAYAGEERSRRTFVSVPEYAIDRSAALNPNDLNSLFETDDGEWQAAPQRIARDPRYRRKMGEGSKVPIENERAHWNQLYGQNRRL